ncbi:hypothetical protein TNCV_1634041 [Trichonephila clavipes]|nr:hypothetical protein TNCV_1634041 [Trichonephila clavipes]
MREATSLLISPTLRCVGAIVGCYRPDQWRESCVEYVTLLQEIRVAESFLIERSRYYHSCIGPCHPSCGGLKYQRLAWELLRSIFCRPDQREVKGGLALELKGRYYPVLYTFHSKLRGKSLIP